MIGYLNIILRLTIWFLLTADLSPANIIIGFTVALLLPGKHSSPAVLKDWLRALRIGLREINGIRGVFIPFEKEKRL